MQTTKSFLLFLCLAGTLSSLTSLSCGQDTRPLYIEGYTGQVSYVEGEEVTFHISTTAPTYSMEITRMGLAPEVVWKQDGLTAAEQAVPENASSHGCGWPVAVQVKVPPEWRSGYYSVSLAAKSNGGKFTQRGARTAVGSCFFIVRPKAPGRDAKILLQLATNTYNAYNNWGGTSLYAYNGRGGVQGSRVSFDRPPASQWGSWELPFVQWAERQGYALDYAANSDLEFHPEMLSAYKLVLSVGHDEYWSGPMRDHLEDYITKGGNVAFFSGNTCCWQVRSEDNGRALTCFKQNYHVDPVFAEGVVSGDYKTLSTAWGHHLLKRSENSLTGVGFLWGGFRKSHGQFMDEPAEFTVYRPDNWVFEGTEMQRGSVFGGKDTLVGYECDGCQLEWRDGLPFPTFKDGTPETFEVLASCPARWHHADVEWYEKWERGRTGAACLGFYTRGGTVFTAGTTDWAHGLRGGDPVVERVTKNVMDRLSR